MSDQIPEHERAIGRILADKAGKPYECARTLEEARESADFAAVFEGDYGGTIFATCPVNVITCDMERMSGLINAIDDIFYAMPEGRRVYFERAPAGSRIAGGDGGGVVEEGVWCHPFVHEIGLCEAIEDVISGKTSRLVVPSIDQLQERAAHDDTKAMFLLWRLLRKSQPSQATSWCLKAAALGHIGAQFRASVDKKLSVEEKARWLTSLSSQVIDDTRIKSARYNLARAYREGNGVAPNAEAEAFLLLLTCNSRFHAGAAMRLAQLYFEGNGVKLDGKLALMWALLGSVDDIRKPPYWSRIMTRNELSESQALVDQIKRSLTPSEIEEAERLASRYFTRDRFPPLQSR